MKKFYIIFYEEDLKRAFSTANLLRVFYKGGVYIRPIRGLLFKKGSSFEIFTYRRSLDDLL